MNAQSQTAEAAVTLPAFVKLPNNKVWLMGVNQNISGAVNCPSFENAGDLESRMDEVSEAVTGSSAGLVDFSYNHVGGGVVHFSGYLNTELIQIDSPEADDEDDQDEKAVFITGDELVQALAAQYQIGLGDAQHAVVSIGASYGDECVLNIAGTNRSIQTPVYPSECDYVRVVVAGDLEIAYWNQSEWKDAPAGVMGAIIGAANGRS